MNFPFYVFGRRGVPQPGAEAIARLAYWAPSQSPIGSGVIVDQLVSSQHPEVVWPWQNIPGGMVAAGALYPAGLGGVQAGQMLSYPLFDPNTTQSASTEAMLNPIYASGGFGGGANG